MSKIKSGKGYDYFGLGRVVSLILVIFPITAWICGAVARFMDGKILAGIIRLIGFGLIIWIVDIVFMIINGKICRFIPI